MPKWGGDLARAPESALSPSAPESFSLFSERSWDPGPMRSPHGAGGGFGGGRGLPSREDTLFLPRTWAQCRLRTPFTSPSPSCPRSQKGARQGIGSAAG